MKSRNPIGSFHSSVLPILIGAAVGLALAGCGRDGGSEPTKPVPPGGVNAERLVPARTVVADTVLVVGSGFGSDADTVTFAGPAGARLSARALTWSDSVIEVLVPDSAVDGSVRVRAAGGESGDLSFAVAPRLISFSLDLLPNQLAICGTCHGAALHTNDLVLDSAVHATLGNSVHGPVIIARRSDLSIITQKVSPNPPFLSRMPQGGPYLSDPEILEIADWIDQGARNN